MATKKKYLVLGGAGQIGEPLCDFLISKGHDVKSIDLVYGNPHDLRKANSKFKKEISSSDFIFFLAFDVGGSRYLKDYQYTFEFINNNTLIMLNVFDMIKKYNKPFIFTSSQMSNMLYSPYGVQKALGECYTQSLNGITVKFWNVYGPEKDLSKSHVITDLIIKARDSIKDSNVGVVKLLSSGKEQRQFLYVSDCSEALYLLSNDYENVSLRENPLHITNFEWDSILEISNLISNEFLKRYRKKVLFVPATEGDLVQLDKRNEPDKFILNFWNPKVRIQEGIKTLVEYFVEGEGKDLSF